MFGKVIKKRSKISEKSKKNCILFSIDNFIVFCVFLDSFLMDFERENGEGESAFFKVFRVWPFRLVRQAAQDPQGLPSGRPGLAFWAI